jgi:hypothetical protein
MSIKDNFPTVRPQLLIDIGNTEVLDPRVVSSRASVATYYDKFGVLQTANANEPRVGYNPSTGAVEGLIREAQGTNLALYSEQFDNAYWAKSASGNGVAPVVTANAAVAPDGTITADKIDFFRTTAVSPNLSYISSNTITTTAGLYTGTLWVKAATALDVGKQFNMRHVSGGVGVIHTLTLDWQRIESIETSAGSRPLMFGLLAYTNQGLSETSVSLYAWGAQVEAGAFSTSYIKTQASQVTRAADSFLLTNTSDYDTDAFTAISQPFGVTSVSSGTVTLNGDVPIERLYVYPNNISQDQINSVVANDGWWSWRIVGATFALPNFTTDGSIEVDWGDGTVETLTTAVHTFTNASPHTIRFRQMTGTWFNPFITANPTYKNMVVAVGSAPSNMVVDLYFAFRQCTNLKSFDATLVSRTNNSNCFESCTSLKSCPVIDMSACTNFTSTWYNCASLQSLPLIDTSAGTNFTATWYNCNSLTSFPLIDTSAGTNFQQTWQLCTSLTSFPLIDTSSGTNFLKTWSGCSQLQNFPLIDTSVVTNFSGTWELCTSLQSFPLINVNLGTYFNQTWYNDTSLTSFPANMFDSWTGVPVDNCFLNTWLGCTALTTTSVENILVSIDTSGTSAPATGTEITISYNVATGALTSPTTSAITSLKAKNWTIKINGVLQ